MAILSNCEGAFGAFYEPDIAGAQVPLINRGAKAENPKKPSDGITGAEIAGKKIEIVGYGCSDGTADKAIEETRRLMEQEDADILIGPLSGDESIAVANYAKEHPDKTFINGAAGAQDASLKVQAPNFFRFNTDGAQFSAGLGDYAYNELGWRTAAVIGDDYAFPYTSLAGFIAEFCSVGGKVTKRVWPPLGEKDYSSYISQIPEDVDGLYVGVGGSGLISFIKQYEQQRGKIDTKKIMGNVFWPDPLVLKEVGDRLVGGVTAGPTSGDSTDPAAKEYVGEIKAAYPEIAPLASSVFVYHYYIATGGLGPGDGGGQRRHLRWPEGAAGGAGQRRVRRGLWATSSSTRTAVRSATTTSSRSCRTPTATAFRTSRRSGRSPDTDQQFGGLFSDGDAPAPDRENPKCVKGESVPWVGKAEEVG